MQTYHLSCSVENEVTIQCDKCCERKSKEPVGGSLGEHSFPFCDSQTSDHLSLSLGPTHSAHLFLKIPFLDKLNLCEALGSICSTEEKETISS